jgi:hypothetical protein
MKHPFDGILFPVADRTAESPMLPPTRRSILRMVLAGCAAALGFGGRKLWAVSEAQETPGTAPGCQLYFVAPKDLARFTAERRRDLGLHGEMINGLRISKELAGTKGFLGWLAPEQAAKLGEAADVKTVHKMEANEKQVIGRPDAGRAVLMIRPVPNRWREKPPAGTYLSVADLAAKWSKWFADHKGVRVSPLAGVGQVHIAFDGAVPDKVLEQLKADPQVDSMEWSGQVTTLALGEEGERRPPITTKALGEEGERRPPRPPITTKALGEEGGGRPPITTKALGEEG